MALKETIRIFDHELLVTVNPATGIEIGLPVPVDTEEMIREKAIIAKGASDYWKNLTLKERGKFFRALKHAIVANSELIAKLISEENGKNQAECWEEILVILQLLNFYQKRGLADTNAFRGMGPMNIFKKIRTSVIPGTRGRQLGAVGVITPWNYPFMIPMNIAIRSLFYGNAAVIKPSEQTPRLGICIEWLARLAWVRSKLNHYFPYPPVTVVQGNAAAGKKMVNLLNEGDLQFLIFCGSSEAGRKIKQAAKEKDKLELLLGGKDAMVILGDCDLELTTNALVGGCLFNTGQSCSSIERVYVAEEIADTVLEKVLEKVRRMRVGYDPEESGIDLGPIMNRRQFETIIDHLDDAVAKGARILHGGKRLSGGIYDKGYYLEPTVLTNVDHTMKVMTEETFGPVIPIMTATSDNELIRLANDSKFGLTASVWTKNVKRGGAIAERLEAGTVYVNDIFWTAGEPKVHWPGAKESGNFIDEATPGNDKVIAVSRGNFVDKLSLFWLKKNSPWKVRLIKSMVKYGFLF